jgi:hypothetical protein
MSKYITGLSVVVACLLLGLPRLFAVTPLPAFSADLLITRGGRPHGRAGHVYASSGRVRIEAPQFSDGFFVIDGDSHAAWFVRPGQRVFMDARRSSPLTQLLVRVEPDAPCRQWQIMERVAGGTDGDAEWRCDLLGQEFAGRETLKYSVVSSRGQRSQRWIDRRREFPVRIETEDGTMVALENVVDAPQPSDLFTIPADYHKFDPAELIERIKQSDVWVESPR